MARRPLCQSSHEGYSVDTATKGTKYMHCDTTSDSTNARGKRWTPKASSPKECGMSMNANPKKLAKRTTKLATSSESEQAPTTESCHVIEGVTAKKPASKGTIDSAVSTAAAVPTTPSLKSAHSEPERITASSVRYDCHAVSCSVEGRYCARYASKCSGVRPSRTQNSSSRFMALTKPTTSARRGDKD